MAVYRAPIWDGYLLAHMSPESSLSILEGSSDYLLNRVAQHRKGVRKQLSTKTHPINFPAPSVLQPVAEQPAPKPIEVFLTLQTLAKQHFPRVAIKMKGKILFINLGDVITVQAQGNYVSLRRNSGSYLLHGSISVMARKLEPYGFIRIHRSVIVNTAFVEEIKPHSTGHYGLRVKGGEEYAVTRTYKKNLKSLAEFWIGTCESDPTDNAADSVPAAR